MKKGSLGRKTSAVAVALVLMCASFLVGGKVAGAKPTRVLNPHEQPQVQSSETASTPAVPAEIRLVENVKWVKTDAKGRILDYALIAPGEAETCHTDGITDKKSEVDVAEEVPEPATDNLGAASTTEEITIRNVKWVKTNAEGVIVEYAVYSGPTHTAESSAEGSSPMCSTQRRWSGS